MCVGWVNPEKCEAEPGSITNVRPPPHCSRNIRKYMHIFDKYFKKSEFAPNALRLKGKNKSAILLNGN
jgi:hypothetical protein